MTASPPDPTIARYHLIFFQAGDDAIDWDVVRSVHKLLNQYVSTPSDSTEIDIWVHSPGGDAHATYKLFLDLLQMQEASGNHS